MYLVELPNVVSQSSIGLRLADGVGQRAEGNCRSSAIIE